MSYAPGALVTARGRDWVVLPESADDFLILRPLGGSNDDIAGVLPAFEQVRPAALPLPTEDDLGDSRSAGLLRSALQIGFRSTTGPFRSLAGLAVEPRSYQLVPLLLALRQDPTRLLIADDVGIGKTIEAGLVAAELLARGDANGLTVLCSPVLADQWRAELREKFGLEAEVVLPSTVNRLERQSIGEESLFERHRVTIASIDFIKSPRRRHEFLRTAPNLVIVDEAHTAVGGGRTNSARQQRYELVRDLAADPARHLILVTATPHSGDEDAFRNLIGLLDPQLAGLDFSQEQARRLLSRHFVQRRRAHIRKYLDQQTPFPSDRLSTERPYSLHPEYRALFDDVLAYARGTLKADGSQVQQRVSFWSALALLRAMASSPPAAAHTLRNRAGAFDSATDADEAGRSMVLDQAVEDEQDGVDIVPAGDATSDAEKAQRRQLRDFAKRAEQLKPADDEKLQVLIRTLKELLADGFQPIVFCRFIDTAEYVGEQLRKSLRKTNVEVVTGSLPPEERAARVAALGELPGNRVLVATDCLSEGVNLQEQFQAVVHYDLAWNPTRHEQREGRVDRFGQRADEVRAVTIFGSDNLIDGLVLDVLLRKHMEIRKTTGVSVPVPPNSQAVLEALTEGLLLRGSSAGQDTLDFGDDVAYQQLTQQWDSAASEATSRTMYSQGTIHPDEVAAEITQLRQSLGSPQQVENFVEVALREMGGQPTKHEYGFDVDVAELPAGLKDALPRWAGKRLEFRDDFPIAPGQAVLHRTDPVVSSIAQYVLEAALDPQLREQTGISPATRASVIRTKAVSTMTILTLVRYRMQLTMASRPEQPLLAEHAALLGFRGRPDQREWLSPDQVEELIAARATANMSEQQARQFFVRARDAVSQCEPELAAFGSDLAAEMVAAHRRVRAASGRAASDALTQIGAEPDFDVLGIYVYLPEAA